MNSKNYYTLYHPEYLLDLLRAGAVFPRSAIFQLPTIESDNDSIKAFIQNQFPPISLDRYEIWLKFRNIQIENKFFLTFNDIESAHFYSRHRQEATPGHVINALSNFGIAIKEPIQTSVDYILQEREIMVREQVALCICQAWFGPSVSFSKEFIDQVKIGFEHQQSAAPETLTPIASENMWAKLIAYNPGLRKFEEKPNVLQLQDVQEVLKRTDQDFRDQLKVISEKHGVKLSEVILDADECVRNRIKLSHWVVQKTNTPDSYLFELNELLGRSLHQHNFLYSALLYLFWRDQVLNKDYTGTLIVNQYISTYLKNVSESSNRQAIAEALFTIIYAGGPRVFQKALIEARMKILKLNISSIEQVTKTKPLDKAATRVSEPKKTGKSFSESLKDLGKYFNKLSKSTPKEKKTKLQKDIKKILNIKSIKDIEKVEFEYSQYVKLCNLFEIMPNIFDDVSTENLQHSTESLKLQYETNELKGIIEDVDNRKEGNASPEENSAFLSESTQSKISFPDRRNERNQE